MSATIICESGVQRIIRGLPFIYNDGGRKAAGFRGTTGDCVCRAATIASGKPYAEVYALINELSGKERTGKRKRGISSARTGVYKGTIARLMEHLGFVWTPTMSVGSGCKVHLRSGEIPTTGRLVVSLSRHSVAVIDGTVHDLSDPSRGGMRCVYGYWKKI